MFVMAPRHQEITYWDYLQLDQFLRLQSGLEQDDDQLLADELHFIVVHQVFELWFKLILRELYLARDRMAAPRVREETIPYVVHHLRRVNAIFRLAVEQFSVVETLTPQDFLAFRSKLGTASGFQSLQMREIEALMGLRDEQRVAFGHLDPLLPLEQAAHRTAAVATALERVHQARQGITLRTALYAWLYRTPIHGSHPGDAGDTEIVDTFLQEYVDALVAQQTMQIEHLLAAGGDAAAVREQFAGIRRTAQEFLFAADAPAEEQPRLRRIRAGIVFIESYRDLPLLAWPRLLIDTVVEMEELFVLWRTRHARMVERLIGRRVGTGGSSGVDYLDETTRYRIFTELWAVRTLLVPRSAVPPLRHPEVYTFAVEHGTP
jgi:tryptophan 2,3-dioxygenase